jgi:hypothetical protein
MKAATPELSTLQTNPEHKPRTVQCMGKNMQEKWQNEKIVPEACICK